MTNVVDCDIVVREFEHWLQYYVHFEKGMNTVILPLVIADIVPLLSFNKDGYGIK